MRERLDTIATNPRVWLGLLLTSILCGGLIYFCPARVWQTLSASRPEWALVALWLFVLNVLSRGVRLSLFAAAENQATTFSWAYCAARHQLLFSLLPSASGDLGFPYLANKWCGLTYTSGARVIALYRFQDMVALAALFVFGVALRSGDASLIAIAFVSIPVALYWSDRLVGRVLRSAFGIVRTFPIVKEWSLTKKLQQLVDTQSKSKSDTTLSTRMKLVISTIASWTLSAGTFWCLFMMVGEHLDFGTVCVVVAALNLFGIVNTLTVGGLGIGESALATILIALNYSYESAVSTALVVRPTALVVTLAGCILIELAALAVRLRQSRRSLVELSARGR